MATPPAPSTRPFDLSAANDNNLQVQRHPCEAYPLVAAPVRRRGARGRTLGLPRVLRRVHSLAQVFGRDARSVLRRVPRGMYTMIRVPPQERTTRQNNALEPAIENGELPPACSVL